MIGETKQAAEKQQILLSVLHHYFYAATYSIKPTKNKAIIYRLDSCAHCSAATWWVSLRICRSVKSLLPPIQSLCTENNIFVKYCSVLVPSVL